MAPAAVCYTSDVFPVVLVRETTAHRCKRGAVIDEVDDVGRAVAGLCAIFQMFISKSTLPWFMKQHSSPVLLMRSMMSGGQ